MDITLQRILSLIPQNEDGSFKHGALKSFAQSIGLQSGNLISDWKKGRSKSYQGYIYEISAKYDVSIEWLRGETDEKAPAPSARDQPISPVRKKLYSIINESSEAECEKLIDLINLYYGLEQDAAERRRAKKTAPPESEAVPIKEPLFEAGTQVEPGTYVCVDCGKTHVNIHDAGETFPPCGICNSMYYRKITKQFS